MTCQQPNPEPSSLKEMLLIGVVVVVGYHLLKPGLSPVEVLQKQERLRHLGAQIARKMLEANTIKSDPALAGWIRTVPNADPFQHRRFNVMVGGSELPDVARLEKLEQELDSLRKEYTAIEKELKRHGHQPRSLERCRPCKGTGLTYGWLPGFRKDGSIGGMEGGLGFRCCPTCGGLGK